MVSNLKHWLSAFTGTATMLAMLYSSDAWKASVGVLFADKLLPDRVADFVALRTDAVEAVILTVLATLLIFFTWLISGREIKGHYQRVARTQELHEEWYQGKIKDCKSIAIFTKNGSLLDDKTIELLKSRSVFIVHEGREGRLNEILSDVRTKKWRFFDTKKIASIGSTNQGAENSLNIIDERFSVVDPEEGSDDMVLLVSDRPKGTQRVYENYSYDTGKAAARIARGYVSLFSQLEEQITKRDQMVEKYVGLWCVTVEHGDESEVGPSYLATFSIAEISYHNGKYRYRGFGLDEKRIRLKYQWNSYEATFGGRDGELFFFHTPRNKIWIDSVCQDHLAHIGTLEFDPADDQNHHSGTLIDIDLTSEARASTTRKILSLRKLDPNQDGIDQARKDFNALADNPKDKELQAKMADFIGANF